MVRERIILCLISLLTLSAQAMPLLYNKNHVAPSTAYEKLLVEHVQTSLRCARSHQSRLSGTAFAEDREINIWQSDTPQDHLINNLCHLPGACHLHVGLLKGGSFVAALYGNQEVLKGQIGLDWFKECSREQFEVNCAPYLDMQRCTLLEASCFAFDKSLISLSVDIYFYDADHSMTGHELAFTYYDELFADVFIAVVDDWSCPWIRRPTFKAFEKLGYRILHEEILPESKAYGSGQYVAVIKKR